MPNNNLTTKDWCIFLSNLLILLLIIFLPEIKFNLLESIVSFFSINISDYPHLNPPIVFSVGEAISSIAILITVYQFRKERWLVALRVRSYIEKVVFIAISLGLLLTMFSSLIFSQHPENIFQLSIFWQLSGSALILFSIVFLFFKATNKNLFHEKNARKFYEVVAMELSRPTPERVDIILDALLANLDYICKTASHENKNESSKTARVILDVILGESTIVDTVTTKRLDALHYILFTIEKYRLGKNEAQGFPRVVKNLFIDQGSFLYKHFELTGLALSSDLYKTLFGSSVLLSGFNLFGWPTIDYTMRKKLSNLQIKVFIKALSQSIEAYVKRGDIPPRRINDGLSHLSEIFGELCSSIRAEEERGVDTKYTMEDEWWSLHNITHFLGHDYSFIAHEEILSCEVSDREKSATMEDFHSNTTINSGVAAALYEAFKHLSQIKNSNDIYHTVIELMHGMMYLEEYKTGYRKPFEKMIWEQIRKNVINRYYPAVLKTYLICIGFSLASPKTENPAGWLNDQTEKMRRLLYVDLKPLLDKREKMANGISMEEALLPDGMKYRDGVFTYTMGFGKGKEIVILEPVDDFSSALEGVDL